MTQDHFYQVSVSWNENRNGVLASEVLDQKLTIATPPEFPKGKPIFGRPNTIF